jgi:hypothetical protein
MALRAFEVLECEGMARVDLFLRPDGEFLVNEINTIPGFTAISMYPKLWALSGVSPTALVTRLIVLAMERADRRSAIRRSLSVGALGDRAISMYDFGAARSRNYIIINDLLRIIVLKLNRARMPASGCCRGRSSLN